MLKIKCIYQMSLFAEGVKNGGVPQATVTIGQVYNMVKGETGLKGSDSLKQKICRLRALKDEKEQARYKQSFLPYISPAGVMRGRNDRDLTDYSGIMCVDIDHLDERLAEVRQALLADENFCTALLFTSPRGNGLKWFIDVTDQLQAYPYSDIYMAVCRYLSKTYDLQMGSQLDTACKNVGRACFLSYDPECYINEEFTNQSLYKKL